MVLPFWKQYAFQNVRTLLLLQASYEIIMQAIFIKFIIIVNIIETMIILKYSDRKWIICVDFKMSIFLPG